MKCVLDKKTGKVTRRSDQEARGLVDSSPERYELCAKKLLKKQNGKPYKEGGKSLW